MEITPVCTKMRFRSRAEAREWAAAHRKEYGRRRVYRCPDPECARLGVWHLTKQRASDVTYYRDVDANKTRREP